MATLSAKDIAGMSVIDGKKGRRIGKVRHLIFHPTQSRLVGFSVKRPDAALMFKRKDVFVQLHGFDVENGNLVVRDDPAATDAGACKALGISWDDCVIWMGMPVMTEQGALLGYVDDIGFDAESGVVKSLSTETGKAKDALLGRRVVDASLIRGFRRGQGMALVEMGSYDGGQPELSTQRGAIVVADSVQDEALTGGLADAAGAASAVVADKARKGVAKVRKSAQSAAEQAKAKAADVQEQTMPGAQKAAESASDAVNKGAYAAGEQVAKIGGMFSAFADEFKKGLNGEYDEEDQ